MKIGLDASRVHIRAKTGVEHYASHVLLGLVKMLKDDDLLVYTSSNDDPAFENLPSHVTLRNIPLKRLWTHIRLRQALVHDRPDMIFIPAHVMPVACPVPAVVVIHDVAFRMFPENYSLFQRLYLDWSTRYATAHAAAICVISEATKKDLIKYYHCPAEKIFVTYLGHDIDYEKKFLDSRKWDIVREKYHITKDYLLFVGRVESKKNIVRVVEAFYELLTKGHDLQLVLAGKPGYGYEAIVSKIKELNIEDRVLLAGYISEEEKRYLMDYAKVFVFVPIYEGFGLPILEAFASHKKIIASDIPVFQELFSDVVTFVDPYDVHAITRGILQAMEDGREHAEMVYRRREILQKFSWENSVKATIAVLKAVYESIAVRDSEVS